MTFWAVTTWKTLQSSSMVARNWWTKVAACEAALRAYLADEIGSLLRNTAFLEALSGHLPGDETSQARLPIIRERLRLLTRRD